MSETTELPGASIDLAAKAAEMKAKMGNANPAEPPTPPLAERKRVPMTTPQRKLWVPEISGYVCFWFLGKPDRIAQAQAAFFEFVSPKEVDMNETRIGSGLTGVGTDLGDRVSVVAGDEIDGTGQPVRLYLMKQRREYYEEDSAIVEDRNSRIAGELTANFQRGQVGGLAEGETAQDADNRYVDPRRTTIPDLFKPKRRA